MPKPKRPPGRKRTSTRNEKTTIPKWVRWLLKELHMQLRTALVGTLISIIFTVVQPYLNDIYWVTAH